MVKSALIWPSPGVAISSARQESGKLSEHLGRAAHPAAKAPEFEALGELGRPDRGERPRDGVGEHRAALAVEVPREHVQHLHQPGGQRAELLVADADAPVDGAASGVGELARQPADGLGRNPARGRDRLGREVAREALYLAQPFHPAFQAAELHAAFGEEHVRHGEEQRGVHARLKADPLVGALGGAGAPRIHDHHPAPSRPHGIESTQHVRRGQQAPLRGVRVGTEHQQEVAAVEVWQGDAPHAPVEQGAHHVLGPLVDGARRVERVDARHGDEGPDVTREREAVRHRVAHIGGHGRDAVALQHGLKTPPHLGIRLLPGRLSPAPAIAQQRRAQPIGVVVQLTERRALGTDVAPAPDVGVVGADALHLAALHLHPQPAHGLAEGAGSDVDSVCGCSGGLGHAGTS